VNASEKEPLSQPRVPPRDAGAPASRVSRYQALSDADHPPQLSPAYVSSIHRAPQRPLVSIPQTLSELTGPWFGSDAVTELDSDLTRNARTAGAPLGERLVVHGRLQEEDGRPVAGALIEVWQCNSAGRYPHPVDTHDAPLDPHFAGAGRALTDARGYYQFLTIRPGPYPWGNHFDAWRPAHIHFSVLGPSLLSRLVTQMYFPGDPLLERDAIFMSVPEGARRRLIARFDAERALPGFALAYRFDIALRGREQTPQLGL
jgi:protocatechuate 3,4-dioxygenase, beta subunit